jgi:hypothetical protein
MPEYRLYFIGADGHFQTSLDLECTDDAQACEAAKKLVGESDVELWQWDRMIAKFEHRPKGNK